MKTVIASITLGVLSACLASRAFADVLIYEPFNYSSGGAIIGQTDSSSPGSQTWARAGTAAATVHSVASGSLTGPSGFPASIGNAGSLANVDNTEYARMSLGSSYGANASLYYSLLVNVPATNGLTTPNSNLNANNDGIVAFNNASGASGTRPSTWAGELTMRLGATANTFDLGIRASTTAAGTTYWSADLTPGTTYFVVVNFTEGATPGSGGLSSMWINPNSSTFGGSAPAADGSSTGTYTTSASADHTDSLIIGAGIAAGADPNQTLVDEIRVGNTWADVTTVPEPTLGALAGLGVLISLWRFRFGRR
jgi:hypothetical protein